VKRLEMVPVVLQQASHSMAVVQVQAVRFVPNVQVMRYMVQVSIGVDPGLECRCKWTLVQYPCKH